MAVTADGLFSVSFTSTRLEDLATGFHMTITGEDVTDKKTVNVSITDDTGQNKTIEGILGAEEGLVLSTGKSLNRTYEGNTAIIVDPIFELFEKIVVIQTKRQAFQGTGENIESLGAVHIIKNSEIPRIYKLLTSGDVPGFIKEMIGDHTLDLKFKDYEKSPIIAALKVAKVNALRLNDTINAAYRMFNVASVLSVGDIFRYFISPLGLELYWEGGRTYNLQPPRLLMEPKEVGTIDRKDIIELTSVSDPYNVPDLVIPNFTFGAALGSGISSRVAATALRNGVLAKVGRGGKNLKVSTYSIPPFLQDAYEYAARQQKYAQDTPLSATIQSDSNLEELVSSVLSSHARKSNLYKLNSGRCVLPLNPTLNQPYSWYKIDGEQCFVSDIRHEITRNRAVTILTIAGKEMEPLEDPGPTPGSTKEYDKEKKEVEKVVVKGIEELAKEKKLKEESSPEKYDINKRESNKDGKYLYQCFFGNIEEEEELLKNNKVLKYNN